GVVAFEFRLVLRPDLLHRPDLLLETLEPRLVLGAVMSHLLDVPAAADAELEAPGGEEVEARDLLGRGDRVALDDQADAGPDPELLGGRGGRHEGHERVEGVRGLLRERAAAREGRAPAPRDMG